jgi:hypothetical protein
MVGNGMEMEGLVIAALSRSGIPITAVDWNWVPQLEDWQLTVVTSLVEAKGPRGAYAQILDALSTASIYELIPIRKLFVKSPSDPEAQKLVRELKQIIEGSIHIARISEGKGQPIYSVVFAPYVGSGGAIPSKTFDEDAELRSFLEKRLDISSYEVDRAL